MAGLEQLRELLTWMRTEKVQHARCGELELWLSPASLPSPAVVAVDPDLDGDEEDDERRSIEMLLHSSGVEAEPFLRALKRSA